MTLKGCIPAALAFLLAASQPVRADEPQQAVRLNNLVTELARYGVIKDAGAGTTIAFNNPRDGWVYAGVQFSPESPGTEVDLKIAASPHPEGLRMGPPDGARLCQAMWWLSAGDYELTVQPRDGAVVASLTVRAIPELHYCRFPADPVVAEYGSYDWAYLEAHVLANVNTIVGNPGEDTDARITEWTGQGGKWIAYGSLPKQAGLTADQAFAYWAGNPGFTDPRLSGLIADEFQGRQNKLYPTWTEALKRMGADPALRGKTFYGYCGGPGMYARPQARELVRTIFDAGYCMAWERYLHEMPTLEGARALLDSHLGREMEKWRAAFPDCQKHLVLVSGLFTHGLSLDVEPEVDYKVWTDMQMQYLATRPEFDGLFGLHWWNSHFADEETLRWMSRLLRHYAIEGHTDLLSDRLGYRYFSGLIQNPEFADGLQGWTVEPSGPETVEAGYMERYARLQGRYWHRAGFPDEPAGNTYLLMKRAGNAPVTVSQAMRGLKPGALYSVKLMAADYGDISGGVSAKKTLPLAVAVDGAEVVTGKSFVALTNSATSSPSDLPFNSDNLAWFNLHRIVFRARSDVATLRITGWPGAPGPGDASVQAMMINDVEAQPYFDG